MAAVAIPSSAAHSRGAFHTRRGRARRMFQQPPLLRGHADSVCGARRHASPKAAFSLVRCTSMKVTMPR